MRWIGFICISFQFNLSSCQIFYLGAGEGKRTNKESYRCSRRPEQSPRVRSRLIGPVVKSDSAAAPAARAALRGAAYTLREQMAPSQGIVWGQVGGRGWCGGGPAWGWEAASGRFSAPALCGSSFSPRAGPLSFVKSPPYLAELFAPRPFLLCRKKGMKRQFLASCRSRPRGSRHTLGL